MIGFLKGTVDSVTMDICLIDVHGVGYQVMVTTKTASELYSEMPVKLYTHLGVREDNMSLYGFLNAKDLETFRILIGVSGIGAKVAMGILSDISSDELAYAISQKNLARLTKISGIGKKTAERMLLELKDKLGKTVSEGEETLSEYTDSDYFSPVTEVLRSLGYQTYEITKALSKVNIEELSEAEAVKRVLKEISKGR